MFKSLSEQDILACLDSAAVLVAGHAVHLVHDEHVFVAHRLRRAYEPQTNTLNTTKGFFSS